MKYLKVHPLEYILTVLLALGTSIFVSKIFRDLGYNVGKHQAIYAYGKKNFSCKTELIVKKGE